MGDHSKIEQLVDEIKDKYAELGQDPGVFLEGLKHSKLITYWDYCEVDTLLSLQKPRTVFPDENIFIMYHQVTELYFKMILSEIKQISHHENLTVEFFTQRVKRINRYFGILCQSFDVMRDGMEVDQYLKFRHTLTPASGFQSAQYRMIEICCTDLIQLIDKRFRDDVSPNDSADALFQKIYWQAGGKNHDTGEKTLTLQMFEEKYLEQFEHIYKEYKDKNLWQCYMKLSQQDQQNEALIKALKELDKKVNVAWPMVHYKTAANYLDAGNETIPATGGSSWKTYLHPKHQRRIFFPKLWKQDELESWGK